MATTRIRNLYALLNVRQDATQEEIKQRYWKLAKIHHPDKPDGNKEVMDCLNRIFKILGDPEERKAYDSYLAFLARTSTTLRSVSYSVKIYREYEWTYIEEMGWQKTD